jgi:hypothetical protein
MNAEAKGVEQPIDSACGKANLSEKIWRSEIAGPREITVTQRTFFLPLGYLPRMKAESQ